MRMFKTLTAALVLTLAVSCSGKKEEKAKAPKAEAPKTEAPAPEAPEAPDEEVVEAPTPEAPEAKKVDPALPEMKNTIVARVNGKDVDATEHFARLARVSKAKRASFDGKELTKSTVDRMISDLLLQDELKKLAEPVSDQELAEALGMDMARFKHSRARMESRLDSERQKIAITKLLKSRGLLVEPTDEDLQGEFNKRRMIRLNVVNFRVPLKATPEEDAASKAKADEFLAAVKGGADFKESAKTMTDEKLGRRAVRPMIVRDGEPRHKEMWDQAITLEENGIGGPVRTQFGWAAFQVVKKIEPRYAYDEMKERLRKTVISQKSIQAKKRLLNELRKEAKIEYLVEFPKSERPEFLGARAKANVGRIKPLQLDNRRLMVEEDPGTVPSPSLLAPVGATAPRVPAPEAEVPAAPEAPAAAPEAAPAPAPEAAPAAAAEAPAAQR